jgi:signal transduction histidine kinase
MAQSHVEDVLADFAHQLRQPLSALEVLTSYLELIATPEDPRIHEQLRRMHAEIGLADKILRDGICELRAYVAAQLSKSPVAPREDVVEELTRPLTNVAMASVTY